jgi:hypothetical protein
VTSLFEYRCGLLTIRYRLGALDVWFVQRVLSVERFAGKPQIIRYVPGPWKAQLIDAVKVAA